jgi:molybdopterin-binding protein
MTNSTEAIVIDTPEGIALTRLIVLRSALKLEVETGMKATRIPILPAANQIMGTSFKRKAQALAHANELLAEFDARK